MLVLGGLTWTLFLQQCTHVGCEEGLTRDVLMSIRVWMVVGMAWLCGLITCCLRRILCSCACTLRLDQPYKLGASRKTVVVSFALWMFLLCLEQHHCFAFCACAGLKTHDWTACRQHDHAGRLLIPFVAETPLHKVIRHMSYAFWMIRTCTGLRSGMVGFCRAYGASCANGLLIELGLNWLWMYQKACQEHSS